jgi:hypothetical protein
MNQIIIKMTKLTMNQSTCNPLEHDEIENYSLTEWELEMMISPDDGSFWELFSEGSTSPSPSVSPPPITPSPSPSIEEQGKFVLPFSMNSEPSSLFSALYRSEAIKRWREKRNRRCFRKKIVSKARKDYAETRQRKGGRFTKSTAPGWVSITEVNNGL